MKLADMAQQVPAEYGSGSDDFEYNEGTTDDDQNWPLVSVSIFEYITIQLPYSSRSCPVCLSAGAETDNFHNVKDEVKHHEEMHCDYLIIYKCSKCQKVYQKKHPTECHIPKCPGDVKGALSFQCTECPSTFSTRRGLSQHERHRHITIRIAARITGSTSKRVRKIKTEPISRVFFDEDIEKMMLMDIALGGHPQTAMKIAKEFPGKTAKQIRDKRREPAYQKKRATLFQTLQSELEKLSPNYKFYPSETCNQEPSETCEQEPSKTYKQEPSDV